MPQLWTIVLGLGRLANHHRRTYQIKALSQTEACSYAKRVYRQDLQCELGDDPILNKVLTIDRIEVQPLSSVA